MTAFIEQLPDGLKRFSEWHEDAGISRSMAYQLLKLLDIQPEQRRVMGSKKPASFLSAEQQTLLNQAVQALNNGMTLPMIADCLTNNQTAAEIVPAPSETAAEIVPAPSAELTTQQSQDDPADDPFAELNRLKKIADTDWFNGNELAVLLARSASTISNWPENYEIRPEFRVRKRKLNNIWFYKVETEKAETVQDCLALSPAPVSHPGERMLSAKLPSFNCHF